MSTDNAVAFINPVYTEQREFALFQSVEVGKGCVELNLNYIREVDDRCHLLSVVAWGPDGHTSSGQPYYRANMRHAMLLTFEATIRCKRLVLVDGCTHDEALTEFGRLGFTIVSERNGRKRPKGDVPTIAPPLRTMNNQIYARSADVVRTVCEAIANAIVSWPKLITTAEAALVGQPIDNVSCSATEMYIQFASKPLPYGGVVSLGGAKLTHAQALLRQQELDVLARQWPQWLQRTMTAFTYVCQFVEARRNDESVSSEPPLDNPLQSTTLHGLAMKLVSQSQMGDFWAAQWDFAPFDGSLTRSQVQRTERCIQEMKHALASPTESNVWAKVCMTSMCDMQSNARSPATIFGGHLGENGNDTIARRMLERALSTRGFRVVSWTNVIPKGVKPMMFPPNWDPCEVATGSGGGNGTGSSAATNVCAIKVSWVDEDVLREPVEESRLERSRVDNE